MATNWVFDNTPPWVVLLLLFGAMALAFEVGGWIHRRASLRPETDSIDKEAEGYVLSGVLGLLALLVAFTFGMALNRFDVRRELVVQEANALGTAYLRTSLLEDPGRLRDLMREYAQARLEFGLTSGAREAAADRKALTLRPIIWAEAVRLVTPSRQTPLPGFVLDPLNEAFDTATARRTALAARLPNDVVLTLGLYLVASAAVLGFAVAGASWRLRIASLALFGLFVMAIGVILDLDEPRRGPVPVPQWAMAETVHMMTEEAPP
jgi:hypothetical protein